MQASGTVTQDIEFKALEGSLSMMSKVLNDVLDLCVHPISSVLGALRVLSRSFQQPDGQRTFRVGAEAVQVPPGDALALRPPPARDGREEVGVYYGFGYDY